MLRPTRLHLPTCYSRVRNADGHDSVFMGDWWIRGKNCNLSSRNTNIRVARVPHGARTSVPNSGIVGVTSLWPYPLPYVEKRRVGA